MAFVPAHTTTEEMGKVYLMEGGRGNMVNGLNFTATEIEWLKVNRCIGLCKITFVSEKSNSSLMFVLSPDIYSTHTATSTCLAVVTSHSLASTPVTIPHFSALLPSTCTFTRFQPTLASGFPCCIYFCFIRRLNCRKFTVNRFSFTVPFTIPI